jgi:hypothetical protein
MTAPDAARADARPPESACPNPAATGGADTAFPNPAGRQRPKRRGPRRNGPPHRRPRRPGPPFDADLGEIMPAVRRVMLDLAIGANLFLRRMRTPSPFMVVPGDMAAGDGRTKEGLGLWSIPTNRLSLQRLDSVEAARLAAVLGRLLKCCPAENPPSRHSRPDRKP